jgi:hypothetical protein
MHYKHVIEETSMLDDTIRRFSFCALANNHSLDDGMAA